MSTDSRDVAPWLLVGLGNPGDKYARNRHNIGFMAVDVWRDQVPAPPPSWTSRWKGLTCSLRFRGEKCVLLKPQTYMNCSGQSVVQTARYLRIPPNRILVMHDEIDFSLGRLAIKKTGGHGGHNGLRDIIEQLGSRDFLRIRLGVGRSPKLHETSSSATGNVARHVLSDFSSFETPEVEALLKRAQLAITCLLTEGIAAAMNQFNGRTGDAKT